jgi:Carboxypeptidase regulatory-like domain
MNTHLSLPTTRVSGSQERAGGQSPTFWGLMFTFRSTPWLLWRAAAALLLVSISTWGQATTSVRGTVVDPSGKAVARATVVLANSESKIERTTTTEEQGEYQFLLVPPGTYRLTVTASGFRRYEQTDLQLLANTPTTANVHAR